MISLQQRITALQSLVAQLHKLDRLRERPGKQTYRSGDRGG
jgi:hypothetical protein